MTWWQALITGVATVAAAGVAGWFARRTKREEIDAAREAARAADWSAFVDQMQEEMAVQRSALSDHTTRINGLTTELEQVRAELRAERSRGDMTHGYLRRVLLWIRAELPGRRPPAPPPELFADLADVWEEGT